MFMKIKKLKEIDAKKIKSEYIISDYSQIVEYLITNSLNNNSNCITIIVDFNGIDFLTKKSIV
jgi:DNA mismatch repair ATPase MutL